MTTRHPLSNTAFSSASPWVSSASPSRSAGSGVGGALSRFGRGLLMIGVLGGVALASYRNDLLFAAAQSAGVGSRYLELEAAWVGGPAAGTPRALEPLISRSRAWFERLEKPLLGATGPATAAALIEPASVNVETAPEPGPSPTGAVPTTTTSSGLQVVSLDALPVLKEAEAPAANPSEPAEPARRSVTPAESPRPAPVVASAKKAEPPKRAERAREAPARSVAAAPKPETAKPKAAAPRPAPAPAANDNPLKAAIRSAILKEAGGQ